MSSEGEWEAFWGSTTMLATTTETTYTNHCVASGPLTLVCVTIFVIIKLNFICYHEHLSYFIVCAIRGYVVWHRTARSILLSLVCPTRCVDCTVADWKGSPVDLRLSLKNALLKWKPTWRDYELVPFSVTQQIAILKFRDRRHGS